MANPPRPNIAYPDWAANPATGYVITPPLGVQDTGFGPLDVYAPSYYNWVFQRSSDWLLYLGDLFDVTGRLNIGRIVGQGDPGGSGAGLYVTTSSGGITVLPAGNASATISVGGTGTAKLSATAAGGKARIEATGGAGTAYVEAIRTSGELEMGGVELDASFTGYTKLFAGGALDVNCNGATATFSAIGGATTVSLVFTAASGLAALSGVSLTQTFTTAVTTTAPTITLEGATRTRSQYRHDFSQGTLVARNPTDGLLHGYGNTSGTATWTVFVCDVDPVSGGYCVYAPNTTAAGQCFLYAATSSYTKIVNVDNSNHNIGDFHRPLWESKHNSTSSAATSPIAIYRVAQLTATWSAVTGSSFLKLIKRSKTTDTETTILTSTPANPTDTNSGTPVELDTENYTFFLQFSSGAAISNGASNDAGIKRALLTLEKRAVE